MNVMEWVDTEIMRALTEWRKLQFKNESASYYLYGKIGSLIVSENAPDDTYTLVPCGRLYPYWELHQAFNKIRPIVCRFPCLPDNF